ncbi:glycosyltransferase 1 domain-containing protein 1 isoform X1 [Callorhinchus milii]|nr:glycosyltransferase 1 domain-containing protein 1 isoform X1 [Callorhinchus milii]|eukprot:gi/632968167/ref/XP_007900381.1/ PREDICTED: glycosyltransferase 1 domain-containing protein 1 [Callorhinchus milii]
MKLLFLACLSPSTGNCTTAARIREYIQDSGHICVLRDVADFKSSSQVSELISKEKFEAGLVIHLYKGGRLLLESSVPFGAIFGGTDINEDIKDEKKSKVMRAVLQKARFLVAFTDQLKKTAELHWQFASSKIHVQPQGVVTNPCEKFNWREFLQSSVFSRRKKISMQPCETDLVFLINSGIRKENIDLYVFLLVCGLREVKDPLYLVDIFSEWHKKEPWVYLIIIGPKIDPMFAQLVEDKIKRSCGVYLLSELSQEELHAAMKDSFAVVNSSISEGMSSAILEAMDLKVPVLARNIPGNKELIRHEHTGLLFSNPQEFVELSRLLINDTALKERLVVQAKDYVQEYHSWQAEKETYQKLTTGLL